MNEIITKRLHLKPIQKTDELFLQQQVFSDPLVMEFVWRGGVLSPSQQQEFIQGSSYPQKKFGLGLLWTRDPHQPIGFAGIFPFDDLGKSLFEFGFVLIPEFWGQGYASEIGRAQVLFARDCLKLPQIFALAHPENLGSQKTIEKIGLSFMTDKLTHRGTRKIYSKTFEDGSDGKNRTF